MTFRIQVIQVPLVKAHSNFTLVSLADAERLASWWYSSISCCQVKWCCFLLSTARWHHQVQMPSWILIGWQWDSNLSSRRETSDGRSTSNMPRCVYVNKIATLKQCFKWLFHVVERWQIKLRSVRSVVQCPAHDVRYDSSGVILSPGWPESYPNLQMCSWSVTVEKGYNVTVTFESFHTEREFDVLEIFDGKNKAACAVAATCDHKQAQICPRQPCVNYHYWCLIDFSSLSPILGFISSHPRALA